MTLKSFLPRWGVLILPIVLVSAVVPSAFGGRVLFRETFDDYSSGGKMPDGWERRFYWGRTTPLQTTPIREKGHEGVSLRAGQKMALAQSFSRRFRMAGQGRGRLEVEIVYKQFGRPGNITLMIARGPGGTQPAVKVSIKHASPPEKPGQWQRAVLEYDMRGADLARPYVSLFTSGTWTAGEGIALDRITVRTARPPARRARLVHPGGGYAIADAPGQTKPDRLLVDIAGREAATMRLTLTDADGRTVREMARTAAAGEGWTRVAMEIADLPPGEYTLRVEAAGESGWSREWAIHRIPYEKPAVLIHDGTFYADGEPYFPIGIYHASDPVFRIINKENKQGVAPDTQWSREEMFARLKRRGFNVVHYSWGPPGRDYLNAAGEHGLRVLAPIAHDIQAADWLGEHPALFGYCSVDEPKASDVQRIEGVYEKVHALDPYHPIMTAVNSGPVGFGGARFVDIWSPDVYKTSGPNSSLGSTARFIRQGLRHVVFHDPGSTAVIIPQLWMGGRFQHEPTYDQLRAQVYSALTAGARGVFYYSFYSHEKIKGGMSGNAKRDHWFLPDSRVWGRIGKLNAQLRELAPVLMPGRSRPVRIPSTDSPLQAAAWRHQGRTTLLVVNPTAQPAGPVTLRLPSGEAGANQASSGVPAMEPVFAGPSLKAVPGSPAAWRVKLPGYGVGVYRSR